jgi:phosphatidyl-myo-inositol dimannoside synthase
MKSLVLVTLDIYSRTGGIARYMTRFLTALSELHEHKIQVPCTAISLWDGIEDGKKAPPGIRFFPCNHRKFLAIFVFVRQLLTQKPDIIVYGHVLFTPLAILARIIRPHAQQFLIVYGIEVWGGKHRSVPKWERWLVQHLFDRIITISRYTQGKMMEVYGIDENRFAMLPPAVNIESKSSQSDISEQIKLISVCRLTPEDRYKGVDQVIRVLPHILKRYPNVAYTVIGEGPLKAELKKLAEEFGVSKYVHFMGHVSDAELQWAYKQSSIFVLPSSGEGFGIVFLEAFLHFLPVICGNTDASVEVVTNGYNGITVHPKSPTELTDAIIRLISEPELAHKMGQNGYQTVLARYTHEIFCKTLTNILKG